MTRRQIISRAAQKALAELSTKRDFPQSQIKIRERLVEFEKARPENSRRPGTPEQLELALELFDIQADAYLEFVNDSDSQKLYIAILGGCEYGAWDFYIGTNGTEFELSNLFPSQVRRIEDRKFHWINEGWKQVDAGSRVSTSKDPPNESGERQSPDRALLLRDTVSTMSQKLDEIILREDVSHEELASRIKIGRTTYFEVKAGRGGRKARRKVENFVSSWYQRHTS